MHTTKQVLTIDNFFSNIFFAGTFNELFYLKCKEDFKLKRIHELVRLIIRSVRKFSLLLSHN